jgi:hypothetical protein
MRTTLNIDDEVLASAKHMAIEQGIPLSRLIEEAILERLMKKNKPGPKVKLNTFSGSGVRSGINLDDSSSLLNIMDD